MAVTENSVKPGLAVIYAVYGEFAKYVPENYVQETAKTLGSALGVGTQAIDARISRIFPDCKKIFFAVTDGTDDGLQDILRACGGTNCRLIAYVKDTACGEVEESLRGYGCKVRRFADEFTLALRIIVDLSEFAGGRVKPTVDRGKLLLGGKEIATVPLPLGVKQFRSLADEDFGLYGELFASACTEFCAVRLAQGEFERAEKLSDDGLNAYAKLSVFNDGFVDVKAENAYIAACLKSAEAFARFDDYDKAKEIARKAVQTADEVGFDSLRADLFFRAYYLCADICRHSGSRKLAITYALKAVETAERARLALPLVKACLLAYDAFTDETDSGGIFRKSLLERALAFEKELDGKDADTEKSGAMLGIKEGEHSFFFDKDYRKAMSRFKNVADKYKSAKSKDLSFYSDFAAARAGIASYECGEYGDAEQYLLRASRRLDGEDASIIALYADVAADVSYTLAKLYAARGTDNNDIVATALGYCLSAAERYGVLCDDVSEQYVGRLKETIATADVLLSRLDGLDAVDEIRAQSAKRLSELKKKYSDKL